MLLSRFSRSLALSLSRSSALVLKSSSPLLRLSSRSLALPFLLSFSFSPSPSASLSHSLFLSVLLSRFTLYVCACVSQAVQVLDAALAERRQAPSTERLESTPTDVNSRRLTTQLAAALHSLSLLQAQQELFESACEHCSRAADLYAISFGEDNHNTQICRFFMLAVLASLAPALQTFMNATLSASIFCSWLRRYELVVPALHSALCLTGWRWPSLRRQETDARTCSDPPPPVFDIFMGHFATRSQKEGNLSTRPDSQIEVSARHSHAFCSPS
eukprot:120543-Pleurochrysis_carterae.AAC.3